MVIEECALSVAEAAHIDRAFGIDSHSPQGFVMCHRRDYQPFLHLQS